MQVVVIQLLFIALICNILVLIEARLNMEFSGKWASLAKMQNKIIEDLSKRL